MGSHSWIALTLVFLIISIIIAARLIKKSIVIINGVENYKFRSGDRGFIVISENRYDQLTLKESILNSYINSWMSTIKLDSIEKRPEWLVNDFAQIIYKILCSDESPEDSSQHWEGWVANRLGIIHAELVAKALKDKHYSSTTR